MTADALSLIAQREEALDGLRSGYGLKKLAENRYGLRTKRAVVDTAAIDTRKLIVPGTITTQDEDRSRDIVVTSGVDLTDHKPNPVVLYEHGLTEEIGTKAIARAADDDGAYQVIPEEFRLRSYSHFSEKFEFSEQLFELYAEGFLKGLSIGIIPTEIEVRRDLPPEGGWPGLLIKRCKLFEYSFCSVPDNPQALADKIIGKGLICGRTVLPGILKSLTPHLPERREQVASGYEPQTEPPTMTTPAAPAATLPATPAATPTAPVTKATAPGKTATPLYTKSEDGSYVPLDGDGSTTTAVAADAPESPDEETLSELPDRPVGAIVGEGIHDRLLDLAEFIETAGTRQENTRLREILDALAGTVTGACDEINSFYESEYPDLDPLEKAAEPEEPPEETGEGTEGEDEPPSKKSRKHLSPALARLADRLSGIRKQRQLRPKHKRLTKGASKLCMKAAGFLDEVSDHAGELKESHKSAASYHSRQLKDLAQSSDGESGEDDEMKSLRAENAEMRKKLKTLLDQHDRLVLTFRRAKRGSA